MLGASGSVGRRADQYEPVTLIFPLTPCGFRIAVLFNVFGFLFVKTSKFGPASLSDEPSPFVDIEFHRTFVSHF